MRKVSFFKKTIFSLKKGFTLVEIILALAIMSILTLAISSAMSYGTDYYIKNRKVSQATSYANDLINGINQELYNAYGAYMENETQTGQGASMSFSSDAKYSDFQRRIFLDTSAYKIVCQNKDGTEASTLKSKYQKDLYVKNLMFEVRHNPAYDVEGVASSGMFDATVDNIVVFSFQIYDAENLKLLYEVKNFSIVIDNMVNRINSSENVNKSAAELRAMLVIKKGKIDPSIPYDVDTEGYLNDDTYQNYLSRKADYFSFENLNENDYSADKNLNAKYYNILYYRIDP